jgi:transposase
VDIHQNARTTPRSREMVVERVVVEGQNVRSVAVAFGIAEKTVRKWVQRFRTEGRGPAGSIIETASLAATDTG